MCFLRRYHFFSYARYFPFFMGSKGSVLSSRQPDARLLPEPDGSNLFSHPFKAHFNTFFPYMSSNLFPHFKLSKQISPSVTCLIHSITPWFNLHNNILWWVQFIKFLLSQISSISWHFPHASGPKYSPQDHVCDCPLTLRPVSFMY
jgi:hypothetical protein